MVTCCKIHSCIRSTKRVGKPNQDMTWIMAHSMRWKPCLTLLRWPRTREQEKPDTTKGKYQWKALTDILLCLQISALLRISEQLPPAADMTTARQCAGLRDIGTRGPKWDLSNKPLPSGLRELCRRGKCLSQRGGWTQRQPAEVDTHPHPRTQKLSPIDNHLQRKD